MTDLVDGFELDLESLLTDAELATYSGKSSVFPHSAVLTVDKCIQMTGLLERVLEWREEDRLGKHPGGPAPYVNDHAMLVVMFLLAREHAPLNLTEMANVLHQRLSAESRKFLGIPSALPPRQGGGGTEKKNWFNQAYNAFHRLVDTMDPHLDTKKTRRYLLTNEQREKIFTARDRNMMRRRKERLDLFSEKFVQMTFTMQPRRLRRLQRRANLSVDQTPLPVFSKKGTKRDQKTKGMEERLVAEIDAGWYVKGEEYIWGFAANFIINTADTPGTKPNYPITIRAFSLSKPGEQIGGEAVKLARQLIKAGHVPGRFTADRGYFPNEKVSNLHRPLRDMEFDLVFDMKRTEFGKQDGGQNGTIYVEGEHLCPGTPKDLINLSVRAEEKEFDEHTYRTLIDERARYAARNKEKPDADGKVKKMCPALGPQAKIECPLREIHPDSSKKTKPRVLKKNVPEKPPAICCQSSVVFEENDDTLRFAQKYRFQSSEWAQIYKFDRNAIEGMNGYIKNDAHESLSNPQRRSARGMAAQQVLITMLVVSANMRKLQSFLAEEGREIFRKIEKRYPESRRRDRKAHSMYKRTWGPAPDVVIVEGRSEPLRT